MKTFSASPNLRASIHAIIVGHMASALIAAKSDLSNRDACRETLIEVSFGETSVDHLLTLAIDAARIAVATAKEI